MWIFSCQRLTEIRVNANDTDQRPHNLPHKTTLFMFKRNLVPYLIRACKQQHLIKLIVLLMFIVGSQNVHPQQQIAQDAYAIFEQSCFICHGPAGSFKESLLIDHSTLIQNGTVIPGNPNTSELYNRLVATDTTKRMPLNQPQLCSSD